MKQSRWKPVVVAVVMFAVVAAVAVGLYVYKRASLVPKEGFGEPPTAVELVQAKSTMWQPTTDLVGTVVALRSVSLQNEVEGLVTHVGFESGDIVEPGHVMVRLDERSDLAELHSAEAALRVAQAEIAVVQAQLSLAESELRRQESATRATAAIEVDRARAVVERMAAERVRAEAEIQEAQARIEEVKVRLDKRVIRAPFKARVGIRTVHEGQFLAAPFGSESGPIATLQEVADTIFIDFAVPQEYLPRIQLGMSVAGELDGMGGAVRAPIVLTVAAIDATADRGTRNIRVRATVDNRDDSLRPGMFVKIRVPIDDPRPFVTVPVTAIRRAPYADQVFLVTTGAPKAAGPSGAPDVSVSDGSGSGESGSGAASGNGESSKGESGKGESGKSFDGKAGGGMPPMPEMRAHQRFVRLGPTIGDEVIVLEGLQPGDTIAASGSFKLYEGALVMPGMPGPGGPGGPGGGPASAGGEAAESQGPAKAEGAPATGDQGKPQTAAK